MSSRNSVRLWIFIFQFLSRINSTLNIFSQLKSSTIQKVSKVDLTETHHTPFSFPPFHHLQKKFHQKRRKNHGGTARGIPPSLSLETITAEGTRVPGREVLT